MTEKEKLEIEELLEYEKKLLDGINQIRETEAVKIFLRLEKQFSEVSARIQNLQEDLPF